ncbi:MAG: 30S ribosomal protein S20 [Candidatus Dormibacterales bacterium]
MAKRTASAKKQARAGVRRSLRNHAAKSEIKTLVVKARRGLAEKSVAAPERAASVLEAIRALDRAAAKGIVHRNTAARRKARLAGRLAELATAAPAPSGKAGKAEAAQAKPAGAAKKK